MATRTWKIGEYCKGGVITVETKENEVAIIGKDWDSSAGWNKGSSQKNAKEFTRLTLSTDDSEFDRKACAFLMDLTTSYYADQVMEWINSKVDINRQLFW